MTKADAHDAPLLRISTPEQERALIDMRSWPTATVCGAALKLREWMLANNITGAEMARRACMQRHVLYALLRGVHTKHGYLSLQAAFAIEYETKGLVMAYEWLDDPYVSARIRAGRVGPQVDFEGSIKKTVLRGVGGGHPDGVLRNKARTLSRLFHVEWAEVRRRVWEDARKAAEAETADVSHLLRAVDDND